MRVIDRTRQYRRQRTADRDRGHWTGDRGQRTRDKRERTEDRTGQDRTRQDRTGHDRGHDRTGKGRVGDDRNRDRTFLVCNNKIVDVLDVQPEHD